MTFVPIKCYNISALYYDAGLKRKPDFIFVKEGEYLGIMSAKQAAEKWGITTRRVNEMIRGGRIEGVYKVGSAWVMSDSTQKPIDLRLVGKSQKEKENLKAAKNAKKIANK